MKKFIEMQKARERKGLTLEVLAKKLGVSKQYVWDLENKRRVLSYKMAYRIAEILDSKPTDLFLEKNKRK